MTDTEKSELLAKAFGQEAADMLEEFCGMTPITKNSAISLVASVHRNPDDRRSVLRGLEGVTEKLPPDAAALAVRLDLVFIKTCSLEHMLTSSGMNERNARLIRESGWFHLALHCRGQNPATAPVLPMRYDDSAHMGVDWGTIAPA